MLDDRLTAQAKAIYAYFASFAGAGMTAFPRRATIMRDLGLSQATYYVHYNLLLKHGYLSVEQRKNSGKYTVSLYHLPDCIDAPPTNNSPSLPRKRKEKIMSEKLSHGKNGDIISKFKNKREPETPLSEELAHGELLKTSYPLSEKLMSEKPLSEELVHGNFGQAYIKNSSKSNNSFEKEQEYYHQGAAPDDKKPVPLFSLEQAKNIMRYDYWRSEALSWGELKEQLGHFPDLGNRARYERKIIEIIDEIARQIRYMPMTAQEAESISAIFESEAFTIFFDNVLTRWDEIRSAKGYVKASLKNVVANQEIRQSTRGRLS
jgi:hypothetical protein